MPDPISITISVLLFGVGSVTAWLMLFRRGTVQMTQPTKIFVGRDKPRPPDETGLPKVFLRTLLFSTSKHGRVIESLHVALYHNETHQNFTTWVYGERDRLMLGSGLFFGETGVAANRPYSSHTHCATSER
jgi:hypothetical protein